MWWRSWRSWRECARWCRYGSKRRPDAAAQFGRQQIWRQNRVRIRPVTHEFQRNGGEIACVFAAIRADERLRNQPGRIALAGRQCRFFRQPIERHVIEIGALGQGDQQRLVEVRGGSMERLEPLHLDRPLQRLDRAVEIAGNGQRRAKVETGACRLGGVADRHGAPRKTRGHIRPGGEQRISLDVEVLRLAPRPCEPRIEGRLDALIPFAISEPVGHRSTLARDLAATPETLRACWTVCRSINRRRAEPGPTRSG